MATFQIARPPQNRDELYELIKILWGVTIPRTPVCPEHSTPFEALAQAYFAEAPVSVWVGSRGMGGKSRTLAYLALTEAVLLGAEINLLGGSLEQSHNIANAMREGWDAPMAPKHMVVMDTSTRLKLTNNALVRPLTASEKTVRGPHPQRLRLDEIDVMDLGILDSAMGQPMPGRGLDTQTVMSSTWQVPDGTMTEILTRAEEQGWPVHKWCVATDELITTARGEVPIQEVTNQDVVLTRKGWRQVQHVTFMGYKDTVTLKVGDRQLRCTADHRIATTHGWTPAGALAAHAVASIWSDVSVLRREGVTLPAGIGAVLEPPGSGLVAPGEHDVQVLDLDAGAVPAQVIGLVTRLDRADDAGPDPDMSLGGGPASVTLDALDAVPVAFCSWPVQAVSGEHGDKVAVYDIGVEGEHEFIANGIVVHNCYKETMNPVDGWLDPAFVDRKRQEVSAQMFKNEYDLQEPAFNTRAFDTSAVEAMFVDTDHPKAINGTVTSPMIRNNGQVERYIFEEPTREGDYVIAADWAKEQDYTVISVFRHDEEKMRMVAYTRAQRFPWPVMVGWYNELMEKYMARGIHDGTGVGNVINDYIDRRSRAFLMTGRQRNEMLTEYVAAVERGLIESPRVTSVYTAHKFASYESLYNIGIDSHLPDEICSYALAWKATGRKTKFASPIGMPRLTEGMTDEKIHDNYQPSSPWHDVGGKVEFRDFGVSNIDYSAYGTADTLRGFDLGV